MADTLVLLQLEHRTLGRLLALVQEQAQRLREGEAQDLELLSLVFEYFVDYPELCHHPKEDLVFRRLQMKDSEMADAVGDLLLDHEALGELTAETAARVADAAANGGFDALDLSLRLQTFVHEYRRHLNVEDDHFFPTVSRVLNTEDWDLIDFTMFDHQDPLYDTNTEQRFQSLRKRIWEATQEPKDGPD